MATHVLYSRYPVAIIVYYCELVKLVPVYSHVQAVLEDELPSGILADININFYMSTLGSIFSNAL